MKEHDTLSGSGSSTLGTMAGPALKSAPRLRSLAESSTEGNIWNVGPCGTCGGPIMPWASLGPDFETVDNQPALADLVIGWGLHGHRFPMNQGVASRAGCPGHRFEHIFGFGVVINV